MIVSWEGRRAPSPPDMRGRLIVERVDELGGRGPLLQRIVVHSPDGFEIGYGGSGPSDLALNILADYAGWDGWWRHPREPEPTIGSGSAPILPRWVWDLHQDFKRDFLMAGQDQLLVSRLAIERWLAERGIA